MLPGPSDFSLFALLWHHLLGSKLGTLYWPSSRLIENTDRVLVDHPQDAGRKLCDSNHLSSLHVVTKWTTDAGHTRSIRLYREFCVLLLLRCAPSPLLPFLQ